MAWSNLPSFPFQDQYRNTTGLDPDTNLIITKEEDRQTSKAVYGNK